MRVDWFATAGDWGKTLSVVCKDDKGDAVSLAGADTVEFVMGVTCTEPTVEGTATPDPDQTTNKGAVSYTFAEGDLDDYGTFEAVFVVTWIDARLTFPTNPLILSVRSAHRPAPVVV